MTPNQALRNSEEFSRRGQEIYDRDVHPALRPEDEDKFVAIDIESGSYEIDRDDFTATLLECGTGNAECGIGNAGSWDIPPSAFRPPHSVWASERHTESVQLSHAEPWRYPDEKPG
jgi:hypothetical protein